MGPKQGHENMGDDGDDGILPMLWRTAVERITWKKSVWDPPCFVFGTHSFRTLNVASNISLGSMLNQ